VTTAWVSVGFPCPITVQNFLKLNHLSSCHATAEDLSRRVAAFQTRLNQDACAVADRLSVKDYFDPDEEKLRFSR
jgi:hypothetical protein